jgi:hypothetical protein
MKAPDVRAQLGEVISRAIEAGLSMKQFHPAFVQQGDKQLLGHLANTSIALRNIKYSAIYAELEGNEQYHIKLPDGGLLVFQYTFDAALGSLLKHRLCFFPSPRLPTMEEAPELYEDELCYADILLERIVRFPVRFDFDPAQAKDVSHPQCHLTLGQFDNCRIPVSSPVSPYAFMLFVLRNFYGSALRRKSNVLRRRVPRCKAAWTISPREMEVPHLVLWAKAKGAEE